MPEHEETTQPNKIKAKTLAGLSGTYRLITEPATAGQLAQMIVKKAYDEYRIDMPKSTLQSVLTATGITDDPGAPRLWKRVESLWKKRNKLSLYDNDKITFKLSESLSTIISDTQKEINKSESITLYWRITDDIQNICERDTSEGYGNPSSCWYTDYCPNAPYTLESANGIALLISDDPVIDQETGIGRIFIINGNSDELITFNPYFTLKPNFIDISNEHKARIINDILATAILKLDHPTINEETYKDSDNFSYQFNRVNLPNSDTIFINQNNGWILTKENDSPTVGYPFKRCHNPDLEDSYTCENCGCHVTEDEVMRGPDDNYYCEECYNEHFTTCDCCNETIRQDDSHSAPDDYNHTYCEECYNEKYTTCDNCGNTIENDDSMESPDGDTLCEECYNEKYTTCEECNETIETTKAIKTAEGLNYCESCMEDANDETKMQAITQALTDLREKINTAPYTLTLTGYTWQGIVRTDTISSTDLTELQEQQTRYINQSHITSALIGRLGREINLQERPDHIRI